MPVPTYRGSSATTVVQGRVCVHLSSYDLAGLYRRAHTLMRNVDGLQPQEAFDELLKYLAFRQHEEAIERRGVQRSLDYAGSDVAPDEPATALREKMEGALVLLGDVASEWRRIGVRLSDAAIIGLHEMFAGVDVAGADLDLRSAALREFLSPELRRGLGVFLTPDEVVRAMVEVLAPTAADVVCDPACGSGTFLVEALLHLRKHGQDSGRIIGSDISPRMVLLAQLNLGGQLSGAALDALTAEGPPKPRPTVILTNPPFGVYVERSQIEGQKFATAKRVTGRIGSEVLFVEQCLRWLRPGGRLGIVLPKSVVSNATLAGARKVFDGLARLDAILDLPPETFAATGTQTNTSVLFFTKRSKSDDKLDEGNVAVVTIDNVGYDATGRTREGSQLEQAGADLRASITSGKPVGLARHVAVPDNARLQSLGGAPPRRAGMRCLGDLVEEGHARTGKTPPRKAYVEQGGVFAVKVGNLSGAGIDWTPRERNFVRPDSVPDALWLEPGDILLTSSAHNPKYIAKKVDIVHEIPDYVGGRATFVGEVLRLRARPGVIDPFELLAYLRDPKRRALIQGMIRGQTAHLRADDLLGLEVPSAPPSPQLVALLRREAELAGELARVRDAQRRLLEPR